MCEKLFFLVEFSGKNNSHCQLWYLRPCCCQIGETYSTMILIFYCFLPWLHDFFFFLFQNTITDVCLSLVNPFSRELGCFLFLLFFPVNYRKWVVLCLCCLVCFLQASNYTLAIRLTLFHLPFWEGMHAKLQSSLNS